MFGNRILSTALIGLAWIATPALSPAIDVNPTQGKEIGEAAAFFTRIVRTSKNPVIVAMAQDNLRKLSTDRKAKTNGPSATANATLEPPKHSTEVALLPQSDHTFVVPAVVNRKYMATFLIDTGASYTVITPELAASLGIRVGPDNPSVPVTTANGVLNAPVVRLKNVCLGGMQVDEVDVVVTDLGDTPQISGLLGMSFFRGMELSFKQDKLVISR